MTKAITGAALVEFLLAAPELPGATSLAVELADAPEVEFPLWLEPASALANTLRVKYTLAMNNGTRVSGLESTLVALSTQGKDDVWAANVFLVDRLYSVFLEHSVHRVIAVLESWPINLRSNPARFGPSGRPVAPPG